MGVDYRKVETSALRVSISFYQSQYFNETTNSVNVKSPHWLNCGLDVGHNAWRLLCPEPTHFNKSKHLIWNNGRGGVAWYECLWWQLESFINPPMMNNHSTYPSHLNIMRSSAHVTSLSCFNIVIIHMKSSFVVLRSHITQKRGVYINIKHVIVETYKSSKCWNKRNRRFSWTDPNSFLNVQKVWKVCWLLRMLFILCMKDEVDVLWGRSWKYVDWYSSPCQNMSRRPIRGRACGQLANQRTGTAGHSAPWAG